MKYCIVCDSQDFGDDGPMYVNSLWLADATFVCEISRAMIFNDYNSAMRFYRDHYRAVWYDSGSIRIKQFTDKEYFKLKLEGK